MRVLGRQLPSTWGKRWLDFCLAKVPLRSREVVTQQPTPVCLPWGQTGSTKAQHKGLSSRAAGRKEADLLVSLSDLLFGQMPEVSHHCGHTP